MPEAAARPRPAFGRLLVAALALAYPAIVWLGATRWSARALALVLGILLAAGVLLRGRRRERLAAFRPLLPTAVLLALTAWLDDERLLLAVPVLASVALLASFAWSLGEGRQTVIERIARTRKSDFPPGVESHFRMVTGVWCGFFLVNALVAGALALWAPLSWWAAWNGVLSYVLMALLFLFERVVRGWRFYRRGPERAS